ncbi:hypothetical protein P7C31_01280 [Clostridium perfringens]|nr:hypothetical protein [Clostridium perfringens]WFD85173.1 hypothetical protein P7C31_01280 [Clostridium perfringens]WFD97990.1 hypothetical protein P7D00_01280 [Clostridium perfringens]HAT4189600.1 hypothetical protein [Clostridium perfringens]HAT4194954.1 hypothetical protein [Clostridium perfringens]
MDAIHYKVREYKHIVVNDAYVVMSTNESSKFWLSVLNDLKHRWVSECTYVFCV